MKKKQMKETDLERVSSAITLSFLSEVFKLQEEETTTRESGNSKDEIECLIFGVRYQRKYELSR